MSDHLLTLPDNLPVPEDDGACDHLPGTSIPSLELSSSHGSVNVAELATRLAVLYIYPRTGRPGRPVPEGWDAVPGARGCTPQSCAFRDHAAELEQLGACVAGLSAQTVAEQQEVVERLHLPYPVIADPELRFARELGVPTFGFDDAELYKRVTLILERGSIAHVFYPVFPPDRNAGVVAAWLRERE